MTVRHARGGVLEARERRIGGRGGARSDLVEARAGLVELSEVVQIEADLFAPLVQFVGAYHWDFERAAVAGADPARLEDLRTAGNPEMVESDPDVWREIDHRPQRQNPDR